MSGGSFVSAVGRIKVSELIKAMGLPESSRLVRANIDKEEEDVVLIFVCPRETWIGEKEFTLSLTETEKELDEERRD